MIYQALLVLVLLLSNPLIYALDSQEIPFQPPAHSTPTLSSLQQGQMENPMLQGALEPNGVVSTPSSHITTALYEGGFMRMVLTLIVLLFLLFATFWLLRRIGKGKFKWGSGGGGGIRIIERRPLSQKSVLYIVQVEGKKILLAESQVELRYLTTIEEEGCKIHHD